MATEQERRLTTRLVWKIKAGLMAFALAMHWHLETRDARDLQACTSGAVSVTCRQSASHAMRVRSGCLAACTGRLRPGQAAPANRAAKARAALPAAPLVISGS